MTTENGETKISTETPLAPALPICDAHHHLWERHSKNYLLEDLLDDLNSGHNIASTIAVECGYGYRQTGPEEFKPVGETAFLESVAERTANDPAIKPRIVSAIVGTPTSLWAMEWRPCSKPTSLRVRAAFAVFGTPRRGTAAARCAMKLRRDCWPIASFAGDSRG